MVSAVAWLLIVCDVLYIFTISFLPQPTTKSRVELVTRFAGLMNMFLTLILIGRVLGWW